MSVGWGGGGGGGVAAVDVTAAGPHGAANVQAALDKLRVKFGDGWEVVSTLADLDAFAPADGGGQRLLNTKMFVSSALALLDDEYIQYGGDAVINGISAAESSITGNVDGALIRGPVVMAELAINNVHAGAGAKQFAITSTGGRAVRVEYCAAGAGSPLGTVSNCFNVATFERLLINGSPDGLQFSGVLAAVSLLNCAAQGMPAGHIVFDVEASANVLKAFEFNGCSFLTDDASDRGIRIDPGATLPGGAIPSGVVGVNILGCKITGPGEIYDKTGLPLSSSKIIVQGCPTLPDSTFLGDVDFADFTTPIVTSYVGPAPTPWVPVAWRNVGATSVLTLLSASRRHTLLTNALDDFDWSVRADGPTPQSVSVGWSATIETTGGGGGEFIEYAVEKQTAAVGPAWVLVEGSDQRIEQRSVSNTITGLAYSDEAPGDAFRLVSRNATGTSATKNQKYDLRIVKV